MPISRQMLLVQALQHGRTFGSTASSSSNTTIVEIRTDIRGSTVYPSKSIGKRGSPCLQTTLVLCLLHAPPRPRLFRSRISLPLPLIIIRLPLLPTPFFTAHSALHAHHRRLSFSSAKRRKLRFRCTPVGRCVVDGEPRAKEKGKGSSVSINLTPVL